MDQFDFSRLDAPKGEVSGTQTLAMFKMGVERHKQGDLRSAVAVYEEVLKRDPGNAEAQHFLGLAAHQSGQSAVGVELISKAIALKPDVAAMHGNRALARLAVQDPEGALADFDRAIDLDPALPGPLSQGRGNALAEPGPQRRCCRELRPGAGPLHPDSAGIHSDRGNALPLKGPGPPGRRPGRL